MASSIGVELVLSVGETGLRLTEIVGDRRKQRIEIRCGIRSENLADVFLSGRRAALRKRSCSAAGRRSGTGSGSRRG
jgi:hypothetical protein